MRTDGATDGDRTGRREIGWLLDVSPAAAVAALLVGVYALPTALQRELVFEYGTPTLATAYTAHFVHFSASHLTGNLAAFALATGTIYALSVRADRRRIFFAFGATLLIAFPVSLSALNLAVPRNGVTYGFSGLNMALVGFLPIVIATFIERRLGYRVDGTALVSAFSVSVGYAATLSIPQVPRSGALILAAAIVAVCVSGTHRSFGVRGSAAFGGERGDAMVFLAVSVGIWAALLSLGFPTTVAEGGTVTNVYVHFLGYALGFTTAYVAYEWQLVCERPAAMVASSRYDPAND